MKRKEELKSYSEMDVAALSHSISDKQRKLFDLRDAMMTGATVKTSDFKMIKKEIARINTIISLKKNETTPTAK